MFQKTRIFNVLFFLALLFPAGAHSAQTQLGVILNDPTGLSAKIWLDSRSAIDAALTWEIGAEYGRLYFHSDFLRHDFSKFTVDGGKLPLYWGFGGKFTIDNNDYSLGARLPLGVSYIYGNALFDIFFEFVPYLNVLPDPLFGLQGAMGFRIFL